MIVVMKQGSTPEQVDHVVKRVQAMGLKEHIIVGIERTVVACIGDDRFKDRTAMESADGVERVVPILAPYKMASSEMKKERTTIPLGGTTGAVVGGNKIPVIAGPCSVEDRHRLIDLAQALKEAGATALRGGAFKPRTSPYSFQGLAVEGLKYLAEAREKTGLAIITEVMSIDQIPAVVEYSDVLQIGARNAQNYNLLAKVGETRKPVLLKRGMSSTLEEFLLSAEYLLAGGNMQVMLCERGIRTFETDYVRNTLPLAIVPELHRRSHLPVVVDPSHGTGKAHLVPDMCRAAVACGADALILEVHDDPEHAMTDGAQSLNVKQFAEVMKSIKRIALAVDREV